MSKSVIEKLNIVLEKIEQRVVKNVEDDTVSMSFFIENHQDHQAVLYFRDLFASRHAEPLDLYKILYNISNSREKLICCPEQQVATGKIL